MKKLTIVIPTKNRRFYLYRLLNYIIETCDLNIIDILILDSSNEKLSNEIQHTCNLLKFKYVYSNLPLNEFEKTSCLYIDTPYVYMSSDDDLFNIKVLLNCCNYLDNHLFDFYILGHETINFSNIVFYTHRQKDFQIQD